MEAKDGPISLAITGASGSAYALRLLECLIGAGRNVYLMVSQAGQIVLKMESDLELPAQPAEAQKVLAQRFNAAEGQLQVFGRQQWMAPVASGSNPPAAMVVCPCTTGSLSAIACGASNDLIERSADVMLKERRKLILVVRETPFSEIHLENMLKLARMGAVILPANPGFYNNPGSVDDIVDFMVARILDHLDVENDLLPRWGG
ncbi:MAG: UbiX family flavin prenyltransferase [gamma proteobacterium endosymbiont of Lamellibrachia anaximandri]|nr:UbiX family flavin prenyltransferase [gamma proteobacterium endosymbiont of Lamellibrachia anaximandri]